MVALAANIRRSGAFRAWSRARRLSPGVTAAGLRAVWWSLAAGTGAGPGPARGVPNDHHDHVGSAPPGRPGVLRRERRALAGFLAGYSGLAREAYPLDLRQFAVRRARRQPGPPGSLGEQQRPGLGHDPAAITRHRDLRAASRVLCLQIAFAWQRTGPRQALPSQVKGAFCVKGPGSAVRQAKGRG